MHLKSYLFGGRFFYVLVCFCVKFCPSASKNIEFSDSPMPEKEVDAVFSLLMQTNNAACPILCNVKLYKALIINMHINWFM